MLAALSNASGFIAPNEFETAPRTCIECGTELESWQISRCQSCIGKSLSGVVVANSIRWQTCDGAKMCFDCPMADAGCEYDDDTDSWSDSYALAHPGALM